MYRFNQEALKLQRQLRKNRGYSPVDNFFKQHSLIESLYTEIEKNIDNPRLLQQARKQLVISLVSALEVYFKDIIKKAIDTNCFDDSGILKYIKRTYSLIDLKQIVAERFTAGEILASMCSFQNLKAINKIFSLLIGKNFIKAINTFEFVIEPEFSKTSNPPKTTIMDEDKRLYKGLNELYSLRPYITHDQLDKSAITEYQIHKFLSSTALFAIAVDNYINSLISDEDEQNK